jgi:hypothetical protein
LASARHLPLGELRRKNPKAAGSASAGLTPRGDEAFQLALSSAFAIRKRRTIGCGVFAGAMMPSQG